MRVELYYRESQQSLPVPLYSVAVPLGDLRRGIPSRAPLRRCTKLNGLTIQFDTDDSSLLPGAKEHLNRIVGILVESRRADYALRVVGHSDARGSTEYNLSLSERRALAVQGFLLEQGIPESRVEIKFWGEDQPRDPGMNEEAWRKNRRAELVLPDCG